MFKCCFKTEEMLLLIMTLLCSKRFKCLLHNEGSWFSLAFFSHILGDFIHSAFPLFHFCGQVSFCSKKKCSHGHPRLSSVVATTRVPEIEAFSKSSGNFPQFFPSQQGWRPGRPHRRELRVFKKDKYEHNPQTIQLCRSSFLLNKGTKWA